MRAATRSPSSSRRTIPLQIDTGAKKFATSPGGLPHFFTKVIHGHSEWPPETQVDASRLQLVDFEGEPIVLAIVTRKGREALMSVSWFEEQDGAGWPIR